MSTFHQRAEAMMRAEIAAIGAHLDRRLGNKPGTAERGIYYWCWPPEDCGLATLMALHADAVGFVLGVPDAA